MLRKLEPVDFSRATPIFKELKDQIVIGSVIEGNTRGEIYVNDLEAPTFAVLWDKMDAIFVEGILDESCIESFASLVSGILKPDAKKRGLPFFNIYYPDEAWADVMGSVLEDLSPQKALKYYYEFDGLNRSRELLLNLDDNYQLKRIDEELLERKELVNLDKVTGWITSFWPSLRRFNEKGVGFCVLKDKTIASWCLSVFVYGDIIELGLETMENFRGKGFAKVVSSACIDYCTEQRFKPLWNCNSDNIASVHVAEAVGFKRKKEYFVWHINLRETP